MSTSHHPPLEILSFCKICSQGLAEIGTNKGRIKFVSDILPPLLLNPAPFRAILHGIINGSAYPDTHYSTMFANELILYLDPDGRFSLRMFLWAPGEYDPVHDHNSWGVIGPVSGSLDVTNYRCEHVGNDRGTAYIVETKRRIIHPGETYHVLPLDRGIHRTGNPTDNTIIQISVYGTKQTDRNFVNTYNPDDGSVSPLYTPKIKKRVLAEQALTTLKPASR